jgi:hypothetical protein
MRVAVLLLGMLGLSLLQVVEVRRRMQDPEILTRTQYWRRLLTVAVLQLVLLMWLFGDSLVGRQPPLVQLAYWISLPLLAIGAIFSAVREMAEVSRQYHRMRADLYRREAASKEHELPHSNQRGASAGNGSSG